MTRRQAIYRQADVIIANINLDVAATGKGARAGHNITSDMTPAEFASISTGRA